MKDRFSLFYHLVLRSPARVLENLEKLHAAGRIDAVPNLWQASLGVFYMVHRMLFRPETIGLSDGAPVRSNLRAHLLANRTLRFPFLLAARAVYPLNLTGFSNDAREVLPHLVGAYHPGDNAIYDLESIGWDRESLLRLRADVLDILAGKTARARFLQDLTVYEGYHARLLQLVERALAGDFAPAPGDEDNPDTTLRGFVRWCAAQPATPEETLRSLLRRELHFGPPVAPAAS